MKPKIVVIMGVSGTGKTFIGQRLAAELGWQFQDADAFHSAANIAKMRQGIPLTDRDRQPWLNQLQQAILNWYTSDQSVVFSCSALKEQYRQQLQQSVPLQWVYLKASAELVRARLQQRQGHFMGAGLLESQLQILEEPQQAIVVDASLSPEAIVSQIKCALGLKES